MISSEEALPGSQRPGQTGGGVKGILSGPQQIDALLLSAAEQVAVGGDPLGENDAGDLSHEGHGGHILVGHDREPGGVLSGPALERVTDSYIKELALLNTIPVEMGAGCEKIKYLSVAPMFAEAIERIYQEISIAKLFN